VMKMGDDTIVTKHWRQDWQYEPASVLVFIGGNAWETREVPASLKRGEVVADRLLRSRIDRATALSVRGHTAMAYRNGRRRLRCARCLAGT